MTDLPASTRVFLALVVALATLAVGAVAPRLVIPEVRGATSEADARLARYALVRAGNAGGFPQQAPRTRVSVVEIQPDPSGCDWGYGEPVSGVAIVRTYTLFGIPWETWRVDCRSERLERTLFFRQPGSG